MLFGVFGLIIFSFPLFLMLELNQLLLAQWALIVLGVFMSMIVAPIPGILASLFKTPYRSTGFAISYNVAFAIFGGLAPMILTLLVTGTDVYASVAIYVIATSLLTVISIFCGKRHWLLQSDVDVGLDELSAAKAQPKKPTAKKVPEKKV